MRRRLGYGVSEGPAGTHESDTRRCCHCGAVKIVKTNDPLNRHLVDLGGHCRNCDDWICGEQACHERCLPFEKALAAYEDRQRFLRQIHG